MFRFFCVIVIDSVFCYFLQLNRFDEWLQFNFKGFDSRENPFLVKCKALKRCRHIC